jgi:hypothetical protein
MSLTGRIFIILILVMSLMFMTMAVMVYATHENWRLAVERPADQASVGKPKGLKFQLQDEREKNRVLNEEMEALRNETARNDRERNEALAKLETERVKLMEQVEGLNKQRDTLVAKDRENVAALLAAQHNLDNLTAEVNGLRTDIRTAQDDRDKRFDEVVKLTDQIHQAQGNLRRIEERRVQLAGQVAAQKKVLDAHGLTEHTPVDHLPPAVRGKVLAINKDNLVELSLGTDDGLRVGHTVEVFRASSYLGRVEVLSTSNDKSVGKILPDFRKGRIQEGDDVATRFKVT